MTASNDINNSNYTIKAENNVVMNATNINNIHADTNYSATTGATTNETTIEAGNIVSLNATNDITNLGATIKAGDLLYLTAGNDINNEALVNYKINGSATNADGSAITELQVIASNANNIKSTLVSQGTLEAGGNLVLVAGNDINNKGSNITSTGSSYLEATAGDINIETAALRDRTVTTWGSRKKGGTKTEDIITNTESNITSNGNLDMVSGSNITLQAAKVKAADDINITASDNLLLTTAIDSSFVQIETKKKSTFSFKNSTSVDTNTAVLNNEIASTNSGEINLNSGNVTYLEYKTGAFERAAMPPFLKQLIPSKLSNSKNKIGGQIL